MTVEMTVKKTLVAGWFSFEEMGATAGDLLARHVVCGWLEKSSVPYEIATAPPFTGGVSWHEAVPSDYTHVVFVCGPFGNGEPIIGFLERFQHCKLIGLDLSMLQDLDEWNPFDLLLERDSSRASRPDLAFLAATPKVPVVGLLLVHPQSEYRDKGRHNEVHQTIKRFLGDIEAAVVPIDTRLDCNATGLRSSAEIESLISAMDLVVTTRLHGMVLALKNGVPAIAVDPIAGGAKITRQAEALGWPIALAAENVTVAALRRSFDFCATGEASDLARGVAGRAGSQLQEARIQFASAFD